jgi:hypothetical protein
VKIAHVPLHGCALIFEPGEDDLLASAGPRALDAKTTGYHLERPAQIAERTSFFGAFAGGWSA